MLLNFLSNSLKFTNKDGQIIVKLEIIEHQPISSIDKRSNRDLLAKFDHAPSILDLNNYMKENQ